MSSDAVIRVRDLVKSYQIFKRPADRMRQFVFGSRRKLHEDFVALNDVSFDIYPGETVGVIGKNGSGKSTLLEIVCGTLTPTSGLVEVAGQVGALLELGAGFNPEFSGRENVYLNGSILGMSRREVDERLPGILEFASIGAHIDQPVKTYSSGMFVRLAFAVAISMEPDILIVDEALAVGDIRFQRKCYRKFDEMKNRGKTILFVTHSTELVRTHCDRVIFLDQGVVKSIGEPREVVHAYLNMLFNPVTDPAAAGGEDQDEAALDTGARLDAQGLNTAPDVDGCLRRRGYNRSEHRWGDRRATICDYLIRSNGDDDALVISQGAAVEVLMRVAFAESLADQIYGLTVKTVDGMTLFGANTRARDQQVLPAAAGELVTVRFAFKANLLPGDYFISLGVAVDDDDLDNSAVDRRYDLIHIHIDGDGKDFGVASLELDISEMQSPSVSAVAGEGV